METFSSSSYTLIVETTAKDVLPYAIKVLQDKGYKLVTLAECLGVEPYHSVSAPQSVSVQHRLLLIYYPYAVTSRAHGRVD